MPLLVKGGGGVRKMLLLVVKGGGGVVQEVWKGVSCVDCFCEGHIGQGT